MFGYHGNCKSTIRNNCISIARPKGPTFYYDKCEDGTLKLMAPWDILSSIGNLSFAINSLEWNQSDLEYFGTTGVQFRIPKNIIDFTRHGHNESVSERLIETADDKFTKDEPNALFFVIEDGDSIDEYEQISNIEGFEEKCIELNKKTEADLTDNDIKFLNANRWRITKKAAAQLDKEIIVIDRDEFRECEELRLNQMLNAFQNPKRKINFIETEDQNLTQEELLERIIVEFENNVTSNMFAKNKGKFDPNNRQSLYDKLYRTIELYKKSNSQIYQTLMSKFRETIKNEYQKSYSNVGKQVSTNEFLNFYESKTIELENMQEHQEGIHIRALESNEEGIQYSTQIKSMIKAINQNSLYHRNIEHINKVVLFAGLIAKNEGANEEITNLALIAAAFHDLENSGNHPNKPNSVGSAWRIKDFLDENADNSFGINKDNLAILQTVICYNELTSRKYEGLDIKEVQKVADYFDVKPEDIEKVIQISAILKDADTLDRKNSNKKRILNCNSSQKASMLTYAKRINEVYPKDAPLEKVFRIMEGESQYLTPVHTDESEEKSGTLFELYKKFRIDREAITTAKSFLKRTLERAKNMFKGRE